MTSHKQKILIVRNDKLGDFVLSLPVFAMLKQSLPDIELHALVPDYTSDIARSCPYIDTLISDPGASAGWPAQWCLLKQLRQQRYDVVITLFSTTRIGLLLWLTRIPQRIAPATKLAQLFYNKRIHQHRSRSAKPEYIYNLDLASVLLRDAGTPAQEPRRPFLEFSDEPLAVRRERFCFELGIDTGNLLLFLHPGSGGSANNLSIGQYARLATSLDPGQPFTIVLSCGPGELNMALQLAALLGETPHVIYHSTHGLREFAARIQLADMFIGGSTGPLHLAGALDVPTAGFYTRRRSATSLRWQTLNRPQNRLAFSPPAAASAEDMSRVDLDAAAAAINNRLGKTTPV